MRAAVGVVHRPKNDLLEVIHFNEIKTNSAEYAHLLEFDTMQGHY